MSTIQKLTILFAFGAAMAWAGEPPIAPVISASQAIHLELKGVPPDPAARFRGDYPVSTEGELSLPDLSTPVRAAGLSASQLARAIEAAYRASRIYTAPTVMVTLPVQGNLVGGLTITVGGQIRQPGPLRYRQGMTVDQALQAAGGPTEFGSLHRVELIRDGKSQTLDLTKEKDKNFSLKPNDTLEIAQKSINC